MFLEREQYKGGMQMTKQFYFELSLRDDIATGDGKNLDYKAIAGRQISRRKKTDSRKKGTSPGEV